MKYAYDCSGGRSRLVWTSDHNLKVTSYYYGAEGLLWSRCNGEYQVYHYDYRGSVVAVTDIDGNVTDTLKYDAYGSTIERTGESALIFGYNGQYGVLTDPNGLLYMRTRFYNPQLKRFMNADVIDGSIADSTSLNLYTYVNGNPISFVDPFGMSADRGNNETESNSGISQSQINFGIDYSKFSDSFFISDATVQALINEDNLVALYTYLRNGILTAERPANIGIGIWNKEVNAALTQLDDVLGSASVFSKGVKALPYVSVAIDTGIGIIDNINNGTSPERIASDAVVDVGFGLAGIGASALSGLAAGGLAGSAVPIVGNIAGAVGGAIGGIAFYVASEVIEINGKSPIEWAKEGAGWLTDKIKSWFD